MIVPAILTKGMPANISQHLFILHAANLASSKVYFYFIGIRVVLFETNFISIHFRVLKILRKEIYVPFEIS